ncbi:MAG: PfkB family carbohydrate kinase [Chloroflexota bacterium]
MDSPKKCLTIGGWDPCGAFGVPADIKTFAAHGVHGMSVLTVVTAQNSVGWYGAEYLPLELVALQLDAVLGDYGADAFKTGFLGNVELIELIASKIKEYGVKQVVIDPVLINARKKPMFGPEVNQAYQAHLFPLATIITPNLNELNYLVNGSSEQWNESKEGLAALKDYHAAYVHDGLIAIKGLPLSDLTQTSVAEIGDGWFDGEQIEIEPMSKVETKNVSGTGDTFSAAIAARLALGDGSADAIHSASHFVHNAIRTSSNWNLAKGASPIANFDA